MFGRSATVLFRLPAQARLQRSLVARCSPSSSPSSSITLPIRLYATAGRPRKAVGEPSRPLKRAVKRASPKSSLASVGEEETVAPKKVAKPKKKKSVAKKVPAKKPKKALTETQKVAAEKKKLKAKIAHLELASLALPPIASSSAYLAFSSARWKDFAFEPNSSLEERNRIFTEYSRQLGTAWKDLSTAETEHYYQLAKTNRERSLAERKQWVESHSVEEIQKANAARRMLRRLVMKEDKKRSKWPDIPDERRPKRPVNGFLHFLRSRLDSNEFQDLPVVDRSRLAAEEWKGLSESEKQRYKELFTADVNRYVSEHNDVYGRMPPHVVLEPEATAAASAAA